MDLAKDVSYNGKTYRIRVRDSFIDVNDKSSLYCMSMPRNLASLKEKITEAITNYEVEIANKKEISEWRGDL